MKETGLNGVTVHGRISSVSWLEKSPYNGKKERDGKFWLYKLDPLSDGALETLERDLEDVEKVWVQASPLMEWEAPHPAFADMAHALETNPKARRHLLAGSLCFGKADQDECLEFTLSQIEITKERLQERGDQPLVYEIQAIYRDVESRGGDAYAEQKARLIELNEKVR